MPARIWYSWELICMVGRAQDSIDQVRRGLEGDPLSKVLHVGLGWTLLDSGRFAEALSPLYRSLELDPNYVMGRWVLGGAHWMQGRTDAALVEFQRAAEDSGRAPWFLSTLGWALALSGDVGQAQQIQQELTQRTNPPTRPLFLAKLYVALGQNDLAFMALDQALAMREHLLLRVLAPCGLLELRVLGSDSRWPAFIQNVSATVQAASSLATTSLVIPSEL